MNYELPKLNKASWIRNFGRSVKYAAIESFNEHFPMAEAYKNQSPNEDLAYARKELRTRSKFFKFVSKNTGLDTFFQDVDLAYKNMKTSMKSGNFYNSRRAKRAERGMYEAMGFDSSELDELDKFIKSDFNDDSEESLESEGNSDDLSSLEKDLESGFNDTSQIISESVTGSADYIAGSIKGAANIAYAQSLQTIKELKFGFSNLNSGISAINQFNKEQMVTHIANTTKYFETTTSLLQEQNSMLKGLLEIQTNLYEASRAKTTRNIEDMFNSIVDQSTGVIDFGKYLQNVKTNIENRSMLGMVSMMYNMSKQEIINNPMQFLLRQTLSAIGGSKVEKALDDLQQNLLGSLATLNARITRGGGAGGFLGSILSLFGIHEEQRTLANTQFEKGPMQFNGAANKSIVEVIPTYLARIEAALTGGPLKLYDMERGSWTTSKEVRQAWDKKTVDSSQSVQRIISDKARKTVNGLGEFDPKQQEQFKQILSEIVIPTLKRGSGIVDKSVFDENGNLTTEFLKQVGLDGKADNFDPEMVKLVGRMFAGMKDSDRKSLVMAARNDRLARSNMIANIGNTPYDINALLVNGALSGLPDSGYHLTQNSITPIQGVNKNLVGGVLESKNNTVVDILKELYIEVFGIHNLMFKSRGLDNIISGRKLVDFDDLAKRRTEESLRSLKLDAVRTTGVGDIFGSGNVKIDEKYNSSDLENIIKEIKDAPNLDSVNNISTKYRLCSALINAEIPANYESGNIAFDTFINKLMIEGQGNLNTWVISNDFVIKEAIRALRTKESSNKKYDQLTDAEKMKIISDNLQKDAYESEDSYGKYKGNDFFEKLSNANGIFSKLGVITSKAKSLINKPIDFIVNAINNFSSIFGSTLSGDLSGAGRGIQNLLGTPKAYGGNIAGPGPKLYALSPGEKVIPAHLNPDNPNRAQANPIMDYIRETALINQARGMGINVAGGFAGGVGAVDAAQALMANISDIGSSDFRKAMDNFLAKYVTDNELYKAAQAAVRNKDAKSLEVVLTGITAKEIVDKSREVGRTIWGKLGDAANVIKSYIPDVVKNNIEKLKEYTKGGAAIGVMSGLLGGPFGLVGGTLLGTAVGIVHHSDEAQNVLFGPGIGNAVRKFFGGKRGSTYAAVGATVGGLVGGPFGAVGGLLLGTGLNFARNSEKFNEYLFGPKGLVARMDHFFGETFTKSRKGLVEYIQEAITRPIENAMIPVGTAVQIGFRKTFELVDKGIQNVIKPKIFNFAKLLGGKAKENKYLAGAIGGAAGGALVGGPFGAILGGLVGSVAHGTGFDKQFIKLGKVPGKALNAFSNRLAKWEITSGQGFNWSAQERIEKMESIDKNSSYFKSDQYKTDLKMSQSNREELIKVQMLVDVARGVDPDTKRALDEAKIKIQNACIVNGVTNTTTNRVLEAITKLKAKATLQDALDIINDSKDRIPPDKQKELQAPNGALDSAIANYVSIHEFIQNYIDTPNGADKAKADLKNQWNIDSDKESSLKKANKNINRELNEKPLEKKADAVYTAVSAVVEYGEKITDTLDNWFGKLFNTTKSLGYIFNHMNEEITLADDGTIASKKKKENNTITTTTFSPDGGRIVKTEKVDDSGKVLWATEEFFNKDGQKVDPNNIAKDDKRDKESVEAKKKADAAVAKTDAIVEAVQSTAEDTKAMREQNKGLLGFFKKMGKSSNGIIKGLKDVFSFITSPIRSLFGAFDSFMDSIPIIGDAWNYGKMKLRTGAKALGTKAINYIGNKIFNPMKAKGAGWINRQRKGMGDVLQNDPNYKKSRNIIDYLQGKQGPLSDADAQILINHASGIELTPEEQKRFNELRRYNRNAGSFARNMKAWELNTARKYSSKNLDKMMRGGWYDKAMDMMGKENKYLQDLGKLMLSDKNKERVTKITSKLSKPLAAGAKYGSKALGAAGRFAGKWGGKFLGAALDVIDSMAIYNTMKEAEQSVEIPDENPEAALPIMAKMLAGINASIPLLGEAIKRGPTDGIGDLIGAVAENGGIGAAGKVLKGAKAKGAKGLLASGKALLKRGGLKGAAVGAVALGAGYLGMKTGLVSETAAISSAETAANTSRVSSFFTAAYKSICKVASKFLSPEKAKLLSGLGSKLLKTITSPAVFSKVGAKMLRRIAGVIAGPAGWAVLGAFAAKAFYDGFSDANTIWKPKQGEDMTITKKAICGLASALADFCCLDLVMPIDEIVNFIKNTLGFNKEELDTGGSFAESIFDGKFPTVFNIKDKLKNLSDDIFDINITGTLNDYIVNPVKDFFGTLWTKLGEKVTGIIDSVKEYADKLADWWKNFSIKDAVKDALTKGKEYLMNLFNFDVGEKAKEVVKEDSEALNVEQLDADDEAAVEESKFSLSSVFSNIWGTKQENKSSSRGKRTGLIDALNQSSRNKTKQALANIRPNSGDGGYFKSLKWGKGDGGEPNAERIYKYLESKGLGSAAIAGIMGNIQAESGFMPDRVQGAGVQTAPEITVDGQTGYGLCQWTYHTRQQALKDFAASRNKSSSDLETQLDFMLQEINQRDPGMLGRMAKMSPYDAAIHFHDDFEGSADDESMKARRGDYAKEIYQNQGKGILTPGSYSSSAGSTSTSTSGGGGGTTESNGIFGNISKMLENSKLGMLGKQLFGDAGFFTSGLFGGIGTTTAKATAGGGAGSTRKWSGGTGNIINGQSGCADYKQDDERWWNHPYTFSTVSEGGCMPSSFCNMASMYNIKLTPPEACDYAGERGYHVEGAGTALAFYPDAAGKWGVPVKQLQSWDEVIAYLKAGKPVAAGFEGGDGWSVGGHWMLLTHIGDNDMIYVADSRAGKHNTGADISGYHSSQEAYAHWAGPGYAFGAENVPTNKTGAMSAIDFMTKTLKGKVTGEYGESRDGAPHGGIDIGANLGTPILSPVDGKVTKIAYEPGGYGNYLQIKDKNGKYHLFAHLNETPKLELDNTISAGQKIATVGSSGLSSGPHLHYQIDPEQNKEGLKKGPHLDPSSYELDEKTRSLIQENNSVADFKRMQEEQGTGDGGFLDPLKEAITSTKSADYSDKLDRLIALVDGIFQIAQIAVKSMNSETPAVATAGTGGNSGIADMIPALTTVGMPAKMNTTTPGKSIQSIISNMLKIASDNT